MGKLRGKLGKQGVHAAQKPEKHGPLGKAITGRRKPHAALRGLHKGHDARCLAGAVNAVSHEGRPGLGQHDEQQGQGACKTCSIKNIVGKAGAAGHYIRWGSRLRSGLSGLACGLVRRSGFARFANIAKHTPETLGRNGYRAGRACAGTSCCGAFWGGISRASAFRAGGRLGCWFGSWGRGLGGGSGLRGGVFPFRAGLLAPRLTGSLAFGILGAVLGHGIAPSCVFGSPSSTCRAWRASRSISTARPAFEMLWPFSTSRAGP